MAKTRSSYMVKIVQVATGTVFAAMSMTGIVMAPAATASTPTPPSAQTRIHAVQAEMAAAVARGEVSREQADKFVAQIERSITTRG